MFHLSNISGLSSTIVETVSLDVDDFSESFLTCGTCLQVYNGTCHSPKLLPCSHTVCLQCARVIADMAVTDAAIRPRCPVCSAVFMMPAAGPAALPPSFVVNQLLDLMSSGIRRDVVPKCAEHITSELLFCETCDMVFCAECDLIAGQQAHHTASTATLRAAPEARHIAGQQAHHTASTTTLRAAPEAGYSFSITTLRSHPQPHYSASTMTLRAGPQTDHSASTMTLRAGPQAQHSTSTMTLRAGAQVHHSTTTLTSSSAAHNVVPFAVAIRRVSEILQYKALQCSKNLDLAARAVELELSRVDDEAEQCIETLSEAFNELTSAIEQRQRTVTATVRSLSHDKCLVLKEQLALISAEREHVDAECHGLPPDVRAITSRISKLNELLDASVFLGEPRENAYVHFSEIGSQELVDAISSFGAVRTSETFPALCTVEFINPHVTVNLASKARILTYDASGCRQTVGGDPVSVELLDSSHKPVAVVVLDVGDGTYEMMFTAVSAGSHSLTVRIFDRVVGSSSPVTFTAFQFHRPVAVFPGLHQPVAVALDGAMMYVLDTGNSRVAVYDIRSSSSSSSSSSRVSPLRCIINESLSQRGATGMSLIRGSDGLSSLYVINWRTSRVSWFTPRAGPVILHSFDCDEFVEPTAISVDDDGTIFVADNGVHVIFVFASCGKLIRKIELMGSGSRKSDLMTCIYAMSTHRQLLVCDDRVRAFSYAGDFLYELPAGDCKGRGQYGGVTVDASGRYLVSRSERGRCMLQVFASDQRWMYSIEPDPAECRLRRPSGLAVDDSGHVFVADLGNNCVRKFRYI